MAFTTPCFIRVNTPELRKKLEELGYEAYVPSVVKDDYDIITTSEDGFYYLFTSKAFKNVDHSMDIDCGTSEKAFLCIAALRDDSDINQLFYNPHYKEWSYCLYDSMFDAFYMDWCIHARKATIEEIFRHFNKI